jgi:hypothetical protein
VALPTRTREGCPDGLVCHDRDAYAAIALALEALADYALDAWAACQPRDGERGPEPAEGEVTP